MNTITDLGAIIGSKKVISAMITLSLTLIAITPLCGFLFQCGCDWPWAGFDTQCNSHKPNAIYRCPWCASLMAGMISCGLSITAGVWGSTTRFPILLLKSGNEYISRILFGLTGFSLIAIITAIVAAYWQNYQLGIGRYLLFM